MRLVLVSNRLPITAVAADSGFTFKPSPGGVSTGLSSYLENIRSTSAASEYVWIGWPGVTAEPDEQENLKNELYSKCNAYPVFLSETEMDNFYHGFCNRTIWALFHYFPGYAAYKEVYWQHYREVNERFCRAVVEIARPDDIIWIHDYHLMLLPEMLHHALPESRIGFFLHIPFPSFEIFRLLPSKCRNEILNGLLGADLIGFHTYDYVQYFSRCVLRLLGKQHNMGQILNEDRIVKAETFPMGIDFDRFYRAATEIQETDDLKRNFNGCKVILSIDRLDYSKGITHRLRGYRRFLENYPEWRGKIVLLLIVVPSRVGVQQYQLMKQEIDELVGSINGRFAEITWTPILYQFRALPFEELVSLYKLSDVMLVTPLRDGMNLIAKEYIACRPDQTGVLILSEMAGAAKELGEAILINPNTPDEIAQALADALAMSGEEQKRRNRIMQQRLKRYDVTHWANDFLQNLLHFKEEQRRYNAKLLPAIARKELQNKFRNSKRRILMLDYDGTLVPFAREPMLAAPDREILDILRTLSQHSEVVLLTGRDKKNLDDWFPVPEIHLVAEHGVWLRPRDEDWRMLKPLHVNWKEKIVSLMELYADRLPGALIEEKEFSVAFHFRQSDPEISSMRVKELADNLIHLTASMDVHVLEGAKVLEVRNSGVDKGTAGLYFLSRGTHDFILVAGDDWTDEDLFKILPEEAFSLKVGLTASHARYNIRSPQEVRQLLRELM